MYIDDNVKSTESRSRELADAFISLGEQARKQMPEQEEQMLGSGVGDVTLLCKLVDPTKPIKVIRSDDEDKRSLLVIGWMFRANRDIEIPRAPYVVNSGSLIDVEPVTYTVVKSGEEFCLNRVETAMLLSRDEYAGAVLTESGDEAYLVANFRWGSREPIPNISTKDKDVLPMRPIGKLVKNDADRVIGIDLYPEFNSFQTYAQRVENTLKLVGRPNPKPSPDLTKIRYQNIALAFKDYFENGEGFN